MEITDGSPDNIELIKKVNQITPCTVKLIISDIQILLANQSQIAEVRSSKN